MKITEPKRLFDSTLKVTENLITNTGDEKWIISDLWISNSSVVEKYVTLKTEYQGTYDKVKRTLLDNIEVQPKQTLIVGNFILEPNEKLYAYTNGTIHAHYDAEFESDDSDLVFVAKECGTAGNNITLEILNPQKVNSPLSCIVNGKDISISLASDDKTVPQKASLTTKLFDPNNDLVFTSKAYGSDSNNISIEYINPSAPNVPLALDINVWALTVTLGTDDNGNIVTTANALKDYVNSNQELIDVELAEGNDGTGFVRALEKKYLSGGIDANIITTANDVINLVKINEVLDGLVYILKSEPHSGEGLLRHFTLPGTHDSKVQFNYGDADKYNPNHFGITGVDIIGYGRSI